METNLIFPESLSKAIRALAGVAHLVRVVPSTERLQGFPGQGTYPGLQVQSQAGACLGGN